MNSISKLSRREREKLQRRNEILRSATELFFEKPYDNVSMDDIAQKIELSKTTLYLYFKNKQSLYFSVVVKGMKILSNELENAKSGDKTGLNQILSMANAIYNYMATNSDYYKLNLASRSPRFQVMMQHGEIDNITEYAELVQNLFSVIENSLKLGIADGSIRPDIEPKKATMFLGSAIERSVLPAPEYELLFQSENISKREYFEHSMTLLLQGISTKRN